MSCITILFYSSSGLAAKLFQTGAKIGFLNGFQYLCEDVKHCNVEKRHFRLLALLLASMLIFLTGCQKIKDIRMTSVKIASLDVKGLKGADISLDVGVYNPASQITVSEIQGEVRHSGKVIGRVAIAPVVINARSEEIYEVKAAVSIAEGVSFRDLMIFADLRKIGECTVDMSAKAKIKGRGTKKFSFKDIPLKELLEKAGNEKI